MGTVTKALSLLSFFSRERQEIGLTEMTRLTGMNKATVFRMLSELAENGFVEQVGSVRAYRLGPVFLRLASLREAAVPTREVAQNVLNRLSEATGETAHMSTLQGDQLCTLTYSYSVHHGTRVTMEDAEVINFHSTSSGLAVLAYSDPKFTDQILSKPLEQRTPMSETDPRVIREQLTQVRQTGIAENVSGFEKDVHSHACPIFDAQQNCYGAIAVAAPVARMDKVLRDLIRQEVPRAALEMTRLLGGFVPAEIKRKFEKTPR
ncbi:IclR family transcriptional regulator [Shimia abyssi]|uniref:IclR family transcriptional regulator n=1 Tax=Shimia abyssi TaxID=1662395 RepID=A0A2P8F835_9RHOB|nr:IclR family transcriptional regulator [Shimia abyssi]PSL17884.1 IclR family transcriptional regulator [Shimia abyssi]